MFQVRIHGRGGQGVVTTSELLALACFIEGRHAQAFPSFGSERTGAPVASFVRVDDHPIRSHEPVDAPDAVLVQDPTLLNSPGLLAGLSEQGWLLVNTVDGSLPDTAGVVGPGVGLITFPASTLSQRLLGRDAPGPGLLGVLAAATGVVRLPSLVAAVQEHFTGRLADGNTQMVTEGYESAVLGGIHASAG
jgi:pyruvate ferredoxin oxidoreductase gamma subunit